MNYDEIILKIERVIDSCVFMGQLTTAKTYCIRLIKSYNFDEDLNIKFKLLFNKKWDTL